MAGKNDNFDALMAMMALKHILDDTKDIEIHPFTCEVTVTPTSISCSSSGNKAFLEDIDGGMEWAEETSNLIKDIMSEQTIKLTDLMKKKFGFDTVKVKPDSEDGFADFLKNLFGGVQTIANKINESACHSLFLAGRFIKYKEVIYGNKRHKLFSCSS